MQTLYLHIFLRYTIGCVADATKQATYEHAVQVCMTCEMEEHSIW